MERAQESVQCRGAMGIAGGLSRLEGAVLSSGFIDSARPDWHSAGTGLFTRSFPTTPTTSPRLQQLPLHPYI